MPRLYRGASPPASSDRGQFITCCLRNVGSAECGLIVNNRCRECSLPLDQLTVEEKLKAIEMLWDDLCRNEKQIPVADWQKELLDERQRQIGKGDAKSSAIGRR
jgi:hypothetical protein